MSNTLIVDYGPEFLGLTLRTVDEEIVCVVPDHLTPDSPAAAALREMVTGLGGDCGTCGGCPLAAAAV